MNSHVAIALGAATIAVLTGIAVHEILVQGQTPRSPLRVNPSRRFANAVPLEIPSIALPDAADDAPIRIVNGHLQTSSVDRWIAFCGPAIEDALRRGMRTPSEVLAYVMRMALPRDPWPPFEGSSLQRQWCAMVDDVEELLRFEPEPEPQSGSRLRVVR